MKSIIVRLDRVQILSSAPKGDRPPKLTGFAVGRDSFVRRQTTTTTYARCRQLTSLINDAKVYWQYQRLKGWLQPWKITMVADDKTGLSYGELRKVIKHCRYYRFLVVELAIDFCSSVGINRRFIRQHAVFGKSRRRAKRKETTSALLRHPQD